MELAVVALTRWMTYQVPEQDLRIDLSRMPAGPPRRFVMTEVSRPVARFAGHG